MLRQYEIETAFRDAIVLETNGRRTIKTEDFVKNLEKYNWHWMPREANSWIRFYVTSFKDVSNVEAEMVVYAVQSEREGLKAESVFHEL